MSNHIFVDSEIHKLLQSELESKGVGVFVKNIRDWSGKELDKDKQEVREKIFKKAIQRLKVVVQKKLRTIKIFRSS